MTVIVCGTNAYLIGGLHRVDHVETDVRDGDKLRRKQSCSALTGQCPTGYFTICILFFMLSAAGDGKQHQQNQANYENTFHHSCTSHFPASAKSKLSAKASQLSWPRGVVPKTVIIVSSFS